MMAVSLLLPYSKTHFTTPIVPGISTTLRFYGHELGLALIAVSLALICAIIIIVTKNRIPSIIAFFVAVLIAIMLLFLPEQIRFNHIFIKQSHRDLIYQLGFYMMMIGGISIIITALINLILVTKNTPREHSVNPDLIDDLE